MPKDGVIQVTIPNEIEPQGIPNSGSVTVGGVSRTGLTHNWNPGVDSGIWTISGAFPAEQAVGPEIKVTLDGLKMPIFTSKAANFVLETRLLFSGSTRQIDKSGNLAV